MSARFAHRWAAAVTAALVVVLEARAQVLPEAIADLFPGPSSSSPERLVELNGVLLFHADDGIHGPELWRCDGTPAGTSMVRDLRPGPSGSYVPEALAGSVTAAVLNGVLYFVADDGVTGAELWRTDGTPSGTFLVADIHPGAPGSRPTELTVLGSHVVFAADDGVNGNELWRTDGTLAGTQLVKDIHPGSFAFLPYASNPRELTVAGGLLYFQATDGLNGCELWRSDVTTAGTSLAFDLHPGVGFPFGQPNGSFPRELVVSGGALHFVATDGVHGFELWRLAPGGTGAALVQDIQPGPGASSLPRSVVDAGGTLYFAADDGVSGVELWKSDGTTATMVRDLSANPAVPGVTGAIVALGGRVFFAGSQGALDRELWTSDGTAAGTVSLTAGIGLDPRDFVQAAGTLLFRGRDPFDPCRLAVWRSDGTAPGTASLGAIAATGDPSCHAVEHARASLRIAGTRLYLRGQDPARGTELWSVPVSGPPASVTFLGQGCGAAAAPPVLQATLPLLGRSFGIAAAGLTPHAPGGLFMSLGPPVPQPVGGACTVFVDLTASILLLPVVSDANGGWMVSFPLPSEPSAIGAAVTVQVAVFGTPSPLGVDLTNGLAVLLSNW